METQQIIIVNIIILIALILYVVAGVSESENIKTTANTGLLLCFAFMCIVAFTGITQMNRYKELYQSKKCPEYERIDNVYKLK